MSINLDPRCNWVVVAPCSAIPRWELAGFAYQNEEESGGRHNVYITCISETGAPVSGIPVHQAWPDGDISQWTLGGVTDFGLYGGPFYPDQGQAGAYSVYVDSKEHSDVVSGMGLPANRHVCYLLTFRRVVQAAVPVDPSLESSAELRTRIARALRLAADDLAAST